MNVNYFLGANFCAGFCSLYDGFCRGEGDFLHLIKAGPGGGKSSFMRRIAAAAAERGYDTECVLCSGDPDSLDAVYIPELRLGFMDATAPHVCEPGSFSYNSDYVNLGRFCDRIRDPRIGYYTATYRTMYKTAYAYLAAAGSIECAEIPGLIDEDTLEKVRKRARNAALRELGSARKSSTAPCEKQIFVRCISCKGELALKDDVNALCKRIYLLDNRCSLAQVYLAELRSEAASRGAKTILCMSPLRPDRFDALLLPEYGLGFVSASAMEIAEPWRHVRLDALIEPAAFRASRTELRRREKLCSELTGEAVRWLHRAKEHHDELERVYNPHVDFAALDAFTNETIDRIFN